MTPEEKRERKRERNRRYREANKEAIAARKKAYYAANKEAVAARMKAYREANMEAIRAQQAEYDVKNRDRIKNARDARKLAAIAKMGGCCADCKQTFPPAVYDFHHLDPDEKEYNPSKLFSQKDQDRIDAELAKCVLLCSNCHRLRHYKD